MVSGKFGLFKNGPYIWIFCHGWWQFWFLLFCHCGNTVIFFQILWKFLVPHLKQNIFWVLLIKYKKTKTCITHQLIIWLHVWSKKLGENCHTFLHFLMQNTSSVCRLAYFLYTTPHIFSIFFNIFTYFFQILKVSKTKQQLKEPMKYIQIRTRQMMK